MKIFVDTSAFLALLFKSEAFHNEVVGLYNSYKRQHIQFATSDYVLDELFTHCLKHAGEYGAKLAVYFIKEVTEEKELAIIPVSVIIFDKAQELFLKFSEHKISFTDIVSFIICKEYKIDEIFTLDSDFKKLRLKTSF